MKNNKACIIEKIHKVKTAEVTGFKDHWQTTHVFFKDKPARLQAEKIILGSINSDNILVDTISGLATIKSLQVESVISLSIYSSQKQI